NPSAEDGFGTKRDAPLRQLSSHVTVRRYARVLIDICTVSTISRCREREDEYCPWPRISLSPFRTRPNNSASRSGTVKRRRTACAGPSCLHDDGPVNRPFYRPTAASPHQFDNATRRAHHTGGPSKGRISHASI